MFNFKGMKIFSETEVMQITTDYRHPERPIFQKFQTFELGQTIWAETF